MRASTIYNSDKSNLVIAAFTDTIVCILTFPSIPVRNLRDTIQVIRLTLNAS